MDRVKKIQQYLEARKDRAVSIDEMAKDLFISPAQLFRSFKKDVGMTPTQYHEYLRIKTSVDLLLEKENVGDVAFHLGYENYETFTRAFKKLCQISPSDLLWGISFSYKQCEHSNSVLVHEMATLDQIKSVVNESSEINLNEDIWIYKIRSGTKHRPIIRRCKDTESFLTLPK